MKKIIGEKLYNHDVDQLKKNLPRKSIYLDNILSKLYIKKFKKNSDWLD